MNFDIFIKEYNTVIFTSFFFIDMTQFGSEGAWAYGAGAYSPYLAGHTGGASAPAVAATANNAVLAPSQFVPPTGQVNAATGATSNGN